MMSCGLWFSCCLFALKREKQQLEEALQDVRRNEEEMCQSNRSLLARLEEVQVKKKRKKELEKKES